MTTSSEEKDFYKPPKDQWTSSSYQKAASFVPQLTTKLLRLLDPQPSDRILDVGCGDGKFTSLYLPYVREVLGVDASESFVKSAEEEFGVSGKKEGKGEKGGKARFNVVDCRFLETDQESVEGGWDKVISNAALHWILRSPSTRLNTLRAIHTSLRSDGKFIFEMGGAGNVAECLTALTSTIHHIGGLSIIEAQSANPWFFPSEDEMRKLLEEVGFEVELLELEYRPTKLNPEGEGEEGGGLEGWIRLMGKGMLDQVQDEKKREECVRTTCEVLRDAVGRSDGSEWLGYVRLRGVAKKVK